MTVARSCFTRSVFTLPAKLPFFRAFILFMGVSASVTLLAWAWNASNLVDLQDAYSSPRWNRPFGCDSLGRNLFARILQGASISVSIGFAAALLDVVLGTFAAACCLCHHRIDRLILSILDMGYGLPYLVLAAVLSSWSSSSWLGTLGALVIVGWIPAARLLRGHLLSLAAHESILTARLIGLSHRCLFFDYLWPACRPALRIHLAAAVPQAILAESLLSYLGLGIRPPLASLGGLCQEGLLLAWDAPWLAWAPIGTLIFLQFIALWMADSKKKSEPFFSNFRVKPQTAPTHLLQKIEELS